MSSARFNVRRHQTPCQHIREYPGAAKYRQEDTFRLDVKQYVPVDNPRPRDGDITVIAAQGNGFPKECYEPMWDDLLSHSNRRHVRVRGIWIADMSHQSASGVLNEDIQGDDPSWADHARDLLYMINHFREQMPRPIVGIGHSMGCTSLVNLSTIHPRLLSTLVLFEPIIQSSVPQGIVYAFYSDKRQDLWPSRAAAEAAYRESKLHSTWDPRVLRLWLKYGLRSTPTALYPQSPSVPDGAVTLATSKHQESWTYVRPCFDLSPPDDGRHDRGRHPDVDPRVLPLDPFYRAEPAMTLSTLPFLRPSVLYIFSQTSPMSTPEMQDEKMRQTGVGAGGSGGAKAGKVEKLIVSDAGHLLTMEAPEKCAETAAEWLGQWQDTYREEENKARREKSRKSERGGLVVSKEWQDRTRQWMEESLKRRHEKL